MKNTKKIIAVLLGLGLVLGMGVNSFASAQIPPQPESPTISETKVEMKSLALLMINDGFVKRDVKKGYPFISKDNTVYVPVKLVCEKLGYTVSFNKDTQAININDMTEITIGSQFAGNVDLGAKVAVVKGVLYAPVSLIPDALGLEVKFESAYGMSVVHITGEELSDTDAEKPETEETEKETPKTELTDEEKSNGVVAHDLEYTGLKYTNGGDCVGGRIGSNSGNSLTDRAEDATFETDRNYFNTILGNNSRYLNIYGSLTYEELMDKGVSDSMVSFKLSVNDKDQPVMHIWDWDAEGGTTYAPEIEVMNLAMEGFKYYAESDSDGEAIWVYMDKAFKSHEEICDGKVHKFGNTKVVFEDPGIWGVDVVFIDAN